MSERTERWNYVNSKLLSFGVHMDYEGSKGESLQVSFHIYFILSNKICVTILVYIILKHLRSTNLFDIKLNFGVKKENIRLMIMFPEKFSDILLKYKGLYMIRA